MRHLHLIDCVTSKLLFGFAPCNAIDDILDGVASKVVPGWRPVDAAHNLSKNIIDNTVGAFRGQSVLDMRVRDANGNVDNSQLAMACSALMATNQELTHQNKKLLTANEELCERVTVMAGTIWILQAQTDEQAALPAHRQEGGPNAGI
jgi:hypothetical protein